MALFDIQNLTFSYPDAASPALRNVNLSVKQGEFIVLCGRSGCGKSTLLRQLKPALAPYGSRSGEIFYKGDPLSGLSEIRQASEIGFVLQNPENQIVTDKVWHELAYGLESIGMHSRSIRLRVAEMASFFGIQGWYHRDVAELSGGQKQLLNLAAVMAMQPSVIILDEPTSQLDPIAATDFLATLGSINRDLGTTVILSEHRLEEALPHADRMVVMDGGSITACGAPREVGCILRNTDHPMLHALPTPMRVYLALERAERCPLTVREGREYLEKYPPRSLAPPPEETRGESALTVKDLWLRYEKDGQDILRDLNFSVKRGSLYCMVGGNGTGKSTALFAISGAVKAYRGKTELFGMNVSKLSAAARTERGIAMLPQDPQTLFLCSTVREDLFEMLDTGAFTKDEKLAMVSGIAELTEITPLLDMHPYDISGGEQQRAALAKVLLTSPKLLLLDEPTKGMDSFFKRKFAGILKNLTNSGVTIIMVSHDIEFCAEYADQCALFFDGGVVAEGEPRSFFAGNNFYTTAASRMSRHRFFGAATAEDVIELCRKGR